MITTGIIKRNAIGLLCLLIVLLAGLSIYQYQRGRGAVSPSGVESEVQKLEDKVQVPESVVVGAPAPGEDQARGKELEDLRTQVSATEEELAEVNRLITDYNARRAEEEKTRLERQKEAEDYQKRYTETREFKEMQIKNLGQINSELFKRLDLTPENRERFLEMIIEQGTASGKISREFSEAAKGATQERLKELTDERIGQSNTLEDEYKEKMTALLGEEGYETYQVYGNSAVERNIVNAFVNLLYGEEALTEDQRWDLRVAMYKGKSDVKYSSTSRNATQEERTAVNLEHTARTYEAYLRAAGEILSAPQLEKLDEYLKGQLDQLKRNLERPARSGAQTSGEGGD